ncbi:MAG: hypothetical protein ACOC0A_03460 [Planctomycetota bacterium]
MMMQNTEENSTPRWERIREYGLGIGLGGLMALYGLIALVMGRTFLPSLHGNGHTIAGTSGQALAGAYLAGGVYLLLRLHMERNAKSDFSQRLIYWAECLLLLGLIALLVYVLLHVGEVV